MRIVNDAIPTHIKYDEHAAIAHQIAEFLASGKTIQQCATGVSGYAGEEQLSTETGCNVQNAINKSINMATGRSEKLRNIMLALIEQNPGVSSTQLAETMGYQRPTIQKHVRVLLFRKSIHVKKVGQEYKIYAGVAK